MSRTTRITVPLDGLGNDIVYQFLDTDSTPLHLGDMRVGVSVRSLTPTLDTVRTFTSHPDVVRKTDTPNGEVTVSWDGFTTYGTGLGSLLTDPGTYDVVIWAFEASAYPDTPDAYDLGLYGDSDYTA